MYGIKRPNGLVMCQIIPGTFQFREKARIRNPVMRDTAYSIDDLMQQLTVAFNLYDMVVFEFTKEEVEDLLIKKLKGF